MKHFIKIIIELLSAAIVFALSLLIRAYQAIVSPILGPCCRFHPSCSEYAIEALKVHGVFCGLWLAVKRVFSCSGLSEGGVDPVPLKK